MAGEQTAPVTLQLLNTWTVELLPQRSVVLYDRDGQGTEVLFQNSAWASKISWEIDEDHWKSIDRGSAVTDYIAVLETSGLTAGIFYKICVDHDGGGSW